MSLEKRDDILNNTIDNNAGHNNVDNNKDRIKSEKEKQLESVITQLKSQFNMTNGLLFSLGAYQQDNIKVKMEEMRQSFEKNKKNTNATRDAISNLTWGYTEILTYSNLRPREREVIKDLRACILNVGIKYGEIKSTKVYADIVTNFENDILKTIENSFSNNPESTKNNTVSNSNTSMNTRRGSSILGPSDIWT